MDSASVQEAADELLGAYASGSPVEPLTASRPDLSVSDAYAIQLAQVAAWTREGAVVRGHKVGLTSAAMQRQLGVDQPDFGHLTDAMFLPEGSTADIRRFLQPKAEPEIAFVLGRPLRGPGVTVAEALAAVDFMLPALEIIDSRIADWKITLADTIADNASSGAVVLGGRPVRPDALDLALTGCLLHRNGRLEGTGAGGAVLGSPVNALVWLANTVGPLGVTLEAGHVVLPGSVCAAIPFGPGDTVFCAIPDGADTGAITAAVEKRVAEVQQYVPGYTLRAEPQYDDPREDWNGHARVAVFLEVRGNGDYLPPWSGNLDIMTAAAARTGEQLARMRKAA